MAWQSFKPRQRRKMGLTARVLFPLSLLAASCLSTIFAQQQPPTITNASVPALDDNCFPVNFSRQRIALMLFYLVTNGDHWINNSGWPNSSSMFVGPNDLLSSTELSVQNCSSTYYGQVIQLPEQCCWFGVFCCQSPDCGDHDELLIQSCNCTVGAVTGLSLPHNNLTGSLNGDSGVAGSSFPVVEILYLLSCHLRGLGLQNNHLTGGLPSSVTTLSELQTLNLGYNSLNGTLPPTLGQLTAFKVLELTNNHLTGPVPGDLCSVGDSPLTDLFLGSNQLTGSLDITNCRHLILVDVTNNRLSGPLPSISGYPVLHIINLAGNAFNGTIHGGPEVTAFSGILVTDLNLANNRLTGSIPTAIADLVYLTNLNLQNNSLTGSLSGTLFSVLGTLSSLDASLNMLSGSIPELIGLAASLLTMDLSNNLLTGVIPDSLVSVLGSPSKNADFRYNFMSCCGVNFSNTSLRYSYYNYSKPLLPAGLSMSTTLRFVTSTSTQSFQGLSCPYLYNSHEADAIENLLTGWFLDPQYFLFINCTCQRGYVLKNRSVNGEPHVVCELPPSKNSTWLTSNPWVWVIISLTAAALLTAALWWYIFRQGSRPVVLQNFIDMRKRLKGPPLGGNQVSIVVTDIQGFSDLMSAAPELTTEALLIHNSLIRKAKWKNFGFTVEQEGDSYAIAFHEAADAVKFCLQTQQMLAKQEWPAGLFHHKPTLPISATKMTSMKRAGNMLVSNIFQSINRMAKSGDASVREGSSRSDQLPRIRETSCDGSDLEDTGTQRRVSGKNVFRALDRELASGEAMAMPQRPVSSVKRSELVNGSTSDHDALEKAAVEPDVGETEQHHNNVFARARSLPGHHSICHLDGLLVRMGIATGFLPVDAASAGSAVMEQAKVISDAAAGGQVLMCRRTFKAVQHMGEELGCVDHNGTNLSRFNAQRASWFVWRAKKKRDKEEAVLLDMGHFVQCALGYKVPTVLTPQYLGLKRDKGNGAAEMRFGLSPSRPRTAITAASNVYAQPANLPPLASIYQNEDAGDAPVNHQLLQRLQLYQVLAPTLVARGRAFGSKLALKEEWVMLDQPYFSAPGALYAPVSSADVALVGLDLSDVTIAFCAVDGAKAYSMRNRSDAHEVQLGLQAIIRSILRQVSGGYFVKEQDGDLKFVLAFKHPTVAMMVCMAIQECAMYYEWPLSALRQWPEERDGHQLLFRGPRLKMGVCKGNPRSISPDHLGRADYFGASVNQAARLMDAAAHGGQVACEEALAREVVTCWNQARNDPPGTHGPATLSERARQQLWEHFGAKSIDPRLAPSAVSQSFPSSRLQSVAMPMPEEARKPDPSIRQLSAGSSVYGTPPSGSGFIQLETCVERHDEGAEAGTSHLISPTSQAAEQQLPLAPRVKSNVTEEDASDSTTGQASLEIWPRDSQTTGAPSSSVAVSLGHPVIAVPSLSDTSTGTVVLGVQLEVAVMHLGLFKFKGLPEPLSVVHVTPSCLVSRRFPTDPPKGKGARVAELHGIVLTAQVPLLTAVDTFRKHFELLMGSATDGLRTLRTRSSVSQNPPSPNAPNLRSLRSWASNRKRDITFTGGSSKSAELATPVRSSAGTPHAGTPLAGSPHAGTPHAGTPHAGTPHAGTPHAGTPHAGTPHAGTPLAGTSHASMPPPPNS